MAENIYTEQFGNVIVQRVCTTSADLDFDKYQDPGRYDIYEDCGEGKTRFYTLVVDTPEEYGCAKQTRIHEGIVDTRCIGIHGLWSDWEVISGNGGDLSENFTAIYKQTTWEELTEAVDLGKHIYARAGTNIYVLFDRSSTTAKFSRAQQGSIDYLVLNSGGVWSSSSVKIVSKEEFDALAARVAALEG